MPTVIERPTSPELARPPATARVAVVRTRPETVIEDYARVMDLAGYTGTISRDRDTLIKLNLSWTKYFPSCSSQPCCGRGVLLLTSLVVEMDERDYASGRRSGNGWRHASIGVGDPIQQIVALHGVRVEDVEPQRSKAVVVGVRPEQTQAPVAVNVVVPTDKGTRDGRGYIKEFTTSHVSSSSWKTQEGLDGCVAGRTGGAWREPHRIGFER